MLTREQLLNGKSFLPFEIIEVPELGGAIGVRGMTAGDALAFYREITKKGKKADMDAEDWAKLVVRCLVSETGERIFSDDEWETVLIGEHAWPMAALQRVALVAMRLNRGTDAGNSNATVAEDLSSGLH